MAVNSTLLLRVIRQFQRYYDRQFEGLLAPTGISMREMHVVLFLANNPDCDTARDVAELRGLAKSQVSAAVDLLAERGFLCRRSDQTDRRVVHLALTDQGTALAGAGQRIQSACVDTLLSGLTQAEAEQFQTLLEKVLSSAETHLKEGADT